MMRGMRPPISVRRRAGLEMPFIEPRVVWDGLVPAEHASAFAHMLLPPGGLPLVGRWRGETLFHPAGGSWWIETKEGARQPAQLSREGWGYGGPLSAPDPALPAAVRALLEWDKARKHRVPYRVRDPLLSALANHPATASGGTA